MPPTKLASHAPLLRLWTAALMSAVLPREGNLPERRTLFAIDACAQLGGFGLLAIVYTLARSYGMRVSAFFEDLAQIERMLPGEWSTVLNNPAAIPAFGVPNLLSASDLSRVLRDFSKEGRGRWIAPASRCRSPAAGASRRGGSTTSSIRPSRASMTRIPCRAANRRVGEADRRRRFEPGRP